MKLYCTCWWSLGKLISLNPSLHTMRWEIMNGSRGQVLIFWQTGDVRGSGHPNYCNEVLHEDSLKSTLMLKVKPCYRGIARGNMNGVTFCSTCVINYCVKSYRSFRLSSCGWNPQHLLYNITTWPWLTTHPMLRLKLIKGEIPTLLTFLYDICDPFKKN